MSGERNLLAQAGAILTLVRGQKPLIHQITNIVTINDCANVTLAVGASPVMANDLDEVAEVTSKAAALLLNIGTPNTRMLDSMLSAGKQANELGIPVILDPVGVGMTRVRTTVVERLLGQVKFSAIRGNLAEIQRLAGMHGSMRGLDSLATTVDASEAVALAATKLDCVVAATGVVDYVSDGLRTCRINNGDEMMTRMTGAGCMTSALVASCCSVGDVSCASVASGVLVMGIAGEIAKENLEPNEGAGMFRIRLLDAVSKLDAVTIEKKGRIHW